ncbi:MAG TPA: hypothetical protein VJ882_02645 [Desulfuromonadales bacterium]|nr:hypothetical protein [Desulfuromonadales bacterium]
MRREQKLLKKRLFFTLGLCFLSVLLTSQAFAGQETTLFSNTYFKDKGSPETYTDQISVSSGHSNLRLHVVNGPDGKGEVKNFDIALNGVTVMTSSDLKKSQDAGTMMTLPWQEANELEVTLRGQGGNALSIELLADWEAPGGLN